MDTVNRGNAYFLSFMFFLSGTKVMCQTTDVYMYCPAEDWIQGSSITFECLVLKTKFPSSCSLPFADTVRFRLDPTGTNGYTDNCSLSTVTSTCSASSNACSCQTGNATYYKFDYTFTAHSDYDGYWDCSVPCFNGLTPQLSYSSDNCDNRTVIASPTSPTSPGQESDLIWLLLLLLLLIPLLILIIIFCCPCGNIACHWCCCTGRCYCRCADKAGAGCCGAAWCKKEDNFISHVCYLCGYKKVKEEEEFICCSLEKCEVVPTTRSGQRDNKVDADHVATNGAS